MPHASKTIAVLGNGGFGTALACLADANGHSVRLWGFEKEYTERTARERINPRFLPGVHLAESIEILTDAQRACDGADLLLLVIPTQFIRGAMAAIGEFLPAQVPIVSCAKGMEEATGLLPTQILGDCLGERRFYVLSGPCHAEELARGMPAVVVLAGEEGPELVELQNTIAGPSFRIYRSSDPIGVEYGGALKNIIAIAAGMCDGLGLGDNAKSALLTRGLFEMSEIGSALGADRTTFSGLAGIGDLITTSISPHGRNRALGERIGKGETLADVLATTRKVSEGVWTTRAVLEKAREKGIELPIAKAVAGVLFDQVPAELMWKQLMGRLLREES
ncbi:MAG: glycerol-3-phosphate dehydrogenase [Planctomycetota bacterium]|nr:MAG: glycerol-3-phosphate dehydrogenase [Planctomycetota bacterium]